MRDDEPSPPDAGTPSRLHRTLGRLRSFRSGSPFHLGALKRTGSTKSSASDSEATVRTDDRMRKKNKKIKQDAASSASGTSKSTENSPIVEKKQKEGAGAFVRRLGSIGRRRADEIESANSSQSSSARDMDDSNVQSAGLEVESNETSLSKSPDTTILDVAVVHPISTKPFTKSTWKRKSLTLAEMEKPVEEPSPESALKRRIAFVAQASACMSEDVADEEGMPAAVGSLHEAVALARVRLSALQRSASPSPLSRDADTEEEIYDDAMPPYGDLIEPENKTDEPSTSSSHASISGAERREHLYKILVIGELGTGKTSIIKRYVHQFFSQHYRATIGVDFALKVLNWDANTIIRLQLWDIAGQERFGNMTRVYYKEAVAAFIVFDVTRAATFDAVVKWKTDLDAKVQLPDGSPIPCILLANKCDQQKEGIVNTPAKMEEYCREKGFAGWFETSAKENINIEEAARSLVNKILLNDKLLQSNDIRDAEKFNLDHKIANGENSRDGNGKNCSC